MAESQSDGRLSSSWVPLAVGALIATAAGITIPFGLAAVTQAEDVSVSTTLLFGIPLVVYAVFRRRRQDSWNAIYSKLSLIRGTPAYYLLAVLLAALGVALYYPAVELLLPTEALQVDFTPYAELEISVVTFVIAFFNEAFTVALGEELFFRALLGGWAIRRFGFLAGNTLQSSLFVLPHLLVLIERPGVWPLVFVVPLVVGWMNGWLMHRSGSVWPGWMLHSLVNAATKIGL